MIRMRPRRTMVWILLALIGASLLLIAIAGGSGAAGLMASIVGPGWWLMPLVMIVVMTLVMVLVMMPMMGHGQGHEGGHGEGMPEDPGAVAARRYAHGDISREEYLRIKRDLEGDDAP